jgi:hypothetical protein
MSFRYLMVDAQGNYDLRPVLLMPRKKSEKHRRVKDCKVLEFVVPARPVPSARHARWLALFAPPGISSFAPRD